MSGAMFLMQKQMSGQFSSRETAAVSEWIKSGKVLHLMRDHPNHMRWGTELMGNKVFQHSKRKLVLCS